MQTATVRTSLLPPRVSLVLGGSSVSVSRLTTEQTLVLLPDLIALVGAVSASGGTQTIGQVIAQHEASVLRIAAVSLGWEVGAVSKLKSRDFGALIEALMAVNADFLYRVPVVAPPEPKRRVMGEPEAGADEESGEGQEPRALTVENSVLFIERLVDDLRAAMVCTKREALDNTLADNLALFDALGRREAREQLARIDALQSAIAAAFSEDAGKAVQAHTAKLTEQAGLGRQATYTSDIPIVHL